MRPIEFPSGLFRSIALFGSGALGLAAIACGGSATLSAAREGRLADARAAFSVDVEREDFDEADARELALVVANREVDTARGASGAATIAVLATCARHVDDALRAKALGSDAAASQATIARIDAHTATPDELAAYAKRGSEPAMREPGARALVTKDDAKARRAAMTNGDPRVRRAALRAAIDAADETDGEALLEAARVDPDPLARTLALRALGNLGGDRIVLGLADLWTTADEGARQAIADAWAAPKSADAGGSRELLLRVDQASGAPAIAAASALVRLGGAGAEDGAARLARAIEEGLPRDRIYAIAVAPFDRAPVREAIVRAKDEPDETIRVAALARLFEADDASRGAAQAELVRIAEGSTTSAERARGVLARGHVRAIAPRLERDLASKDARTREAAALDSIELGDLAKASRAVIDEDATVRARVACAVLRAPVD